MPYDMLDYFTVLTQKDKEVRDPVSGHAFPMSVNDMHALRSQNQGVENMKNVVEQLISVVK